MAETADILANRPERLAARGGERVQVILPDLAAGCSLADMADIDQVEECWEQLAEVIDVEDVLPITYVNSAANLKAFCGRHGGIVCTSANARAALDWAFARKSRVLFFPDQHLGRNTAKKMGIPLDQMPLWNPGAAKLGGIMPEEIKKSRVLLWRGHCSVHEIFRPQHIEQFREKYPGIRVIVHPECSMDVVDAADEFGSTGKIIQAVEAAPPGSIWAIGTELHLVNRLKQEHPDQQIFFLSPVSCMCSTMYRIDLPHLCWSLDNLAAGTPVNVIEVEPETSRWALLALQRMLEIK
jgi:quinolinate synthase